MSMKKFGKYVVGLKKFVETQMVEKFSSIESEGVGVGVRRSFIPRPPSYPHPQYTTTA
jgi:hypothetical protein